MAGVYPHLTDFGIPQAMISDYHYIMDGFLDDSSLRHTCTLIYPATITECPNCIFSLETQRSANIYKIGGPIPFTNNTLCPLCDGEGKQTAPNTETIYLRVYYTPKEFIKTGVQLQANKTDVQIIGYIIDLPKVSRATEIILDTNIERLERIKCIKKGSAVPWGFGQRYFVQLLERI